MVQLIACEVCGQRVPLTPKAKQVKAHRDLSTNERCAGSGRKPGRGTAASPTPLQPRWRRLARAVIGFRRGVVVVAVTTILGFVANTLGFVTDLGLDIHVLGGGSDTAAPRPMDGTYNLAVSDFVAVGQDPEDRAAQAGQSLASGAFTELDETLCADQIGGFDVACLGPQGVPPVSGTDAERPRRAAETAHDLNTHLLVYGTVTTRRGQLVVQPAVYLAADRLPQLEELAGPHQLMSTGGYVGTGQERRNLLAALRQQLTNIIRVMFALDTYNLGEEDDADALLAGLADDEDWEFDRYVLELITANVRGKQRRYGEAIDHYDESLQLYREATGSLYARAIVGRAEATYHQLREAAGGACNPANSGLRAALVDGLSRTLDNFAAGRSAAERDETDVIVRKAAFGAARAQACLAEAGEPSYWPQAESSFRRLVQTLDAQGEEGDGLTSVEEDMLAESHSFLGFVAWRRTDVPMTAQRLRGAAASYRTAAEVTHLAEREQVYLAYALALDAELARLD